VARAVGKKDPLLEGNARALGYIEEVEEAMRDHRAFALLDDTREHREYRRETCIAVRENIIGAQQPLDVERRVNGCLDVLTIEIHRRTIGFGPSKKLLNLETRNMTWRGLTAGIRFPTVSGTVKMHQVQ
jgi:hypothetical protein